MSQAKSIRVNVGSSAEQGDYDSICIWPSRTEETRKIVMKAEMAASRGRLGGRRLVVVVQQTYTDHLRLQDLRGEEGRCIFIAGLAVSFVVERRYQPNGQVRRWFSAFGNHIEPNTRLRSFAVQGGNDPFDPSVVLMARFLLRHSLS